MLPKHKSVPDSWQEAKYYYESNAIVPNAIPE